MRKTLFVLFLLVSTVAIASVGMPELHTRSPRALILPETDPITTGVEARSIGQDGPSLTSAPGTPE
jgi:hypothetical protein